MQGHIPHLLRRGHLPEVQPAKERHQHWAAAINPAGQSVRPYLHAFGISEIGNSLRQLIGIK